MKLWFFILFIVPAVYGQSTKPLCQNSKPLAYEVVAEMPQNLYAAWWPEFLQTSDGKRWAALMCSKKPNVISGGGICILDLNPSTAGKIHLVTGTYDGQWTRDRDSKPLFTAPNKYNNVRGQLPPGLTFFHHQDVIDKGRSAKSIFNDPVFGNHYHSFGVVDKGVDEQGRRYVIHRAMNDKWGASLRDYLAFLDKSGNTLSLSPLGAELNLTNSPEDTERVRTGPKNFADPNPHYSYYDLPMISPNGRFFSANNRKTMTAQIFEITKTGKRLLIDLGFETGKISFAPEGSDPKKLKIAFHLDQVDPAEGDKMSSIHRGMTKDIIVMSFFLEQNSKGELTLIRDQATRVTASELMGDGNYYPKWISDHEFIYIQSRNQRQSFIKVDVDMLANVSQAFEVIGLADCEGCAQPLYEAVVALGKIYADQCTNFSSKLSAREAQLLTLRLNKSGCESLAQNWDRSKKSVLESKQLYTLRPPKKAGNQRVPGWNFPESFSHRGSERMEKPANLELMQGLTSKNLMAVCEQIKN